MFIAGIVMLIKSPNLLKKRLNAKEKIGEQKLVILLSLLMFVGGFIISGLDYRYGWSNLNNVVVIISCIVFLISYTFLIYKNPNYYITINNIIKVFFIKFIR